MKAIKGSPISMLLRRAGIVLLPAYFFSGPILLGVAYLRGGGFLSYDVSSWKGFFILGLAAPMVGYLFLRRSRRARFAAYIFLTMDILRSLFRGNLIPLAVDVLILLYLQTPHMRAIYPSLKRVGMVSRLKGQVKATVHSLHPMPRGKAPIALAPGQHRPSLISWNLTSACNLRCYHCYLDAGHRQKGELTTKECLRLIDEMTALGTEMLILSGGEPLLRPDIFDLSNYAFGKGLLVVMGSNGSLIDQKVASRLAVSGVRGVGVSLDSLDPVKHDLFRGTEDAWHRTVAAIDACQQQGLEVIVQTTVMDWNYGEIPALIDFAHRLQVHAINFYYLVCTGRGEKLTDITPQQYEESLSFLVDIQGAYPGTMVRARCAPHARRIACQRGSPLLGSAGCLAATSYIRIGPQGEVTPCPYFPMVVGNVREGNLKAIWEGATLLQALRRPQLRGRCGACDYSDVCIGCRARAWATSGDYLAEDPWCAHQPGNQPLPPLIPVEWSPEAEERLKRIPTFIGGKVKEVIERRAREKGCPMVTPELMAEIKASMGGHIPNSKKAL